MMNPEIKTKWLEALRSGKYPQGRFRLHNNEGYCCLGVLCEVMDIPSTYDKVAGSYFYTDSIGASERAIITPRIREIAGLQYHTDAIQTLMYMNDEKELSFTAIADYIERNL